MTDLAAVHDPLVMKFRGEEIEAFHRGRFCIFGDGGDWTSSSPAGAEESVYLRSGAKFFQSLPHLVSGAHLRFELEDHHLALMCASHDGEGIHVAAAREMLRRGGLSESDLQCGAHPSLSARAKIANPLASPLRNNCSGKHAGMLLAAVHMGLPIEGYLDPEHPLQVSIRETVARFAGLDVTAVRHYVDGCSAPTFVVSLKAAAQMFAQHARPGPSISSEEKAAVRRLHTAIANAPDYVGGSERFCSALPRVTKGRLLGKVGAEGFYGVMSPSTGHGIAVHIDDGAWQASERYTAHLLHHLGLLNDAELSALAPYAELIRKNHAGKVIGHFECRLPGIRS